MRTKTKDEKRVARRNLIAGLLAGIILATVAGAYGKTVFTKIHMTSGAKATAKSVNDAHDELANAINKLEVTVTAQAAEIVKLKTDLDCPPGYTRDTTAAATITVCKKGKDEMVKVGNTWIDRYEVSLVDATTFNGGKCDGVGAQYGTGSKDDYPKMFQDSGTWTTRVYACSVSGKKPSGYMTWLQAQQACRLGNKRLCTNGEWQAAAAGTYDPGKHDGSSGGACHTAGSASRKTGQAGAVPSASTSCISSWGAEDMNGNLEEWVDLWGQAGQAWITSANVHTKPWPSTGGYGDGKDSALNINGRVNLGSNGWINGAPAVANRGGRYTLGDSSGTFQIDMRSGPGTAEAASGARCCRYR